MVVVVNAVWCIVHVSQALKGFAVRPFLSSFLAVCKSTLRSLAAAAAAVPSL